jgi:hypothetical protein
VTDLVLIYESVTSSASTVRWLTLHSWTLNPDWITSEWWVAWTTNVLRITSNKLTHELYFITRSEPKRDHHLEQFVCYYLFHPLLWNVCQSRDKALIPTRVIIATKSAFSEPLSSNGLFRHNITQHTNQSKSVIFNVQSELLRLFKQTTNKFKKAEEKIHFISEK